jgi:mono/diheme cytochrome c family protein
LLLVGCSGRPPADAPGREIYDQACATCHGSELEGGIGPALGPSSNAAEQEDSFLQLTITRGRGRMPSFQNTLSPGQIERVIAYLREQQN